MNQGRSTVRVNPGVLPFDEQMKVDETGSSRRGTDSFCANPYRVLTTLRRCGDVGRMVRWVWVSPALPCRGQCSLGQEWRLSGQGPGRGRLQG